MPVKEKGKIKKTIKKIVNTIRSEVRSSRNTPIKIAKRTNNQRNYSLMEELRVARVNKRGRRTTSRLTEKINKQKSKY